MTLGFTERSNDVWNPENYDDRAIGPMGLHDAYLLDAICRYMRPRFALEYGGLLGHSLRVMSPYCGAVISVDDKCGDALRDAADTAGNAVAIKAEMQEFDPSLHTGRLDLILFDASHLLTDSVAAYERCVSLLQPRTVILVHDTGEWKTTDLPPQWDDWKGRRAGYLEEDREFVKYLRSQGWSDVTFENPDELRHGYTVLIKPRW